MRSVINQFKRFRLWEGWVYMLLSLSMVLILVTGFFSYTRISDSLGNLNSRLSQDHELHDIKNIRLNYVRLDNNMEMYLISGDSSYLTEFDTTAMRCNALISTLKKSSRLSAYQRRLIDSIGIIIDRKGKNLDDIVAFRKSTSLEASINELLKQRMQKKQSAAKKTIDNSTPEKKNIWKKLWSKDKNAGTRTESTAEPQPGLSGNVIIKKQDIQQLTESASINPFLEVDQELDVIVTKLCRIVEDIESHRRDGEIAVSERKIKQANQSILLLAISTCLFILFAVIVYFWHIKNLTKMSKNLANSKEMAEELALIKEKFMANMSHEIRTPMNAISGFVDQLHASNLTIGQKKQIEIIQKSIEHVLNIINDILDFSKLNAGKLQLENKGFEIEKTVQQTLEILHPLVAEKDIRISCSIDENIPSILIGDAYRLRQILLNIIGNAIKYTEKGFIDVKVSSKSIGDNIFLISLEVKDSGIGIAQHDLENIFKEYHMAENASWSRAGSSGLGLSITKMLVELHGGYISLDSVINQGTAVSITIPFNGGTAMDLEVENRYMKAPGFLNKKRILIADDEPFNRTLLNNILHKYNAETIEASNGVEALELVKQEAFDCVLMDIKMPEMNGIEASQKIRNSDLPQANVPIIAISAAITAENFSLLQHIGVNSYLEKPFKEHELLNLLYKMLYPDTNIAASDKGPQNQEPPSNAPNNVFDLTELQKQAGNNQAYIIDMLNTLIDSTYKGIEEIEKAIDAREWDRINLVAHRIASPLRFIYANETYDIIKQIESESEDNAGQDIELINKQFSEFKERFGNLAELIRKFIKNQ